MANFLKAEVKISSREINKIKKEIYVPLQDAVNFASEQSAKVFQAMFIAFVDGADVKKTNLYKFLARKIKNGSKDILLLKRLENDLKKRMISSLSIKQKRIVPKGAGSKKLFKGQGKMSMAKYRSKMMTSESIEIIRNVIRDIIIESNIVEDYKQFFKNTLQKYGVNSPDELSDKNKKKFFDEVDSNWKAKKETD